MKQVSKEYESLPLVKSVVKTTKDVVLRTGSADTSNVRRTLNTLTVFNLNDAHIHVSHFNGYCVQIKDGCQTVRYSLYTRSAVINDYMDVINHPERLVSIIF